MAITRLLVFNENNDVDKIAWLDHSKNNMDTFEGAN
jgi:hypothetical protein